MRVLVLLVAESDTTVGSGSEPSWIDRFARIYYGLSEAAAEIVLASRRGGPSQWGFAPGGGAAVERLRGDRPARDQLADTLRFDQIFPEDFDAVICLGCPGRSSPVGADSTPVALVVQALDAGKAVAAICADLNELPQPARSGLLIAGADGAVPEAMVRALLAAVGTPGAA